MESEILFRKIFKNLLAEVRFYLFYAVVYIFPHTSITFAK